MYQVFKFHKTAAEMHKILMQAFSKHTLGQVQIYDWFKHFKIGWTSTGIKPEIVITVQNATVKDCKQ